MTIPVNKNAKDTSPVKAIFPAFFFGFVALIGVDNASAQQNCVRDGRTNNCAQLRDLGPPTVTPAQTRNGRIVIQLNMREWPSFSAPVLTVIPQNTCVPVGPCTYQTDGWWCRARFNGRQGFVKKIVFDTANRNRPAITFRNRC